MLERDVQRIVISYAKTKGIYCRKFASDNFSGVPDYILTIDNRVLFIEFKATGERARPLQIKEHKIIRKSGCTVAVVDDVTMGKFVVDQFKTDTVI